MSSQFSDELSTYILSKDRTTVEINNKKIALAKKYALKEIPLNSEILTDLDKTIAVKVKKHLVVKNVRSRAGVTVIALMSKPHKCPHGKCIYCPGGIEKKVPQSYTGFEPATMRAKANNYNPYMQVMNRINQLKSIGHDVSKLELIIMGGTFNSMPLKYQTFFVKKMYDAVSGKKSKNLVQSKKNAEYSELRPVGLTLETRPDWCKEKEILQALDFGATRIELGVQTLSDSVYKKVKRGHKISDVIKATQLLKDSGFKVLYHMMPGLYSDPEKDLKMFRKLFSNPQFKPDMLKIYPTLVMPDTKLCELYKQKKFVPYDDKKFYDFLIRLYPVFPYWVRVMRVQRDIPSTKVFAGPLKSNTRELVINKLTETKRKIKEIRFREVGVAKNVSGPFKIFVEKYIASKGKELFISYETKNRETLIGFLRLRFPYKPFIPELKESAIVRELHVYGNVIPVNKKSKIIGQHIGIGSALLKKAEELAILHKFRKIAVISGIGVREYYYKRGYKLDGNYVSKHL